MLTILFQRKFQITDSMRKKSMELYCDHTIQDVDALLKRDWALDISDLCDLLDELPDDIHDYVYQNRASYPLRVRDLFENPCQRWANKLKPISDKDMDLKYKKEQDDHDAWVKEHRKNYIAPPRPRELIDDLFDELQLKIQKKRDSLTETKQKGKYLPPGQRNATSENTDLLSEITNLENELFQLSKRVDSCNKTWTELQWIDAICVAERPSCCSPALVSEASV